MFTSIKFISDAGGKFLIIQQTKIINRIFTAFIHKQKPVVFKDTLVYWTLQHFKTNKTYQTHSLNNVINTSPNEITQLLKNSYRVSLIDTNELLNSMIIISQEIVKDKELIRNVDKELCERLYDQDIRHNCNKILTISDTLIRFTSNRLDIIKSYKICVESIKNILKFQELTLQHFIQATFYTSILKDDPLARTIMNIILKNIYNKTAILHTISPIELAIFGNSIYKTSTKIKSKKILRTIVDTIKKNESTLFKTPMLGISILKPLHQAKYQDYEFLKTFSNNILNKNGIDINVYQFTDIVYVSKLFSNALYNDQKLIDYLSNLALVKLKEMYENEEYIRAKDISTLLKAFCELGIESLKDKVSCDAIPLLYDAIQNRLIQKNELRSMMEIILWICVLDSSLFERNFINDFIDQHLINTCKKDVKGIAQMNLLITILSIEGLLSTTKEKQLVKLIEPMEDYDLSLLNTRRPKLQQIYKTVQCLSATNNKYTIKSVNLECQIPNLYIPGITITTQQSKIAIESLDEKVCLHESTIPNGYMKLKLRLLRKLGYEIITIPQNVVDKGIEELLTTIDNNITKMEDKRWLHFS